MPNMPKPKKMKTRHQITAVISNKVDLFLENDDLCYSK